MSQQFKASVWVHRSNETGKPLAVELTTISGEALEIDFILYMDEHTEDPCVIERFSQLKVETPYNVIGYYWYCDGEPEWSQHYDLQIDSYVEIACDDRHTIIDEAAAYAMAVWHSQGEMLPF